jgi:hypothetical protein
MLFSLVSGTLLLISPVFAEQYTFVTLDVWCRATAAASDCPAGLAPGQVAAQTGARGINDRGDVVGFYAAGGTHGFLLSDGQYTSLDFPLAGVRATIANGINDRGEIVGQYTLPVRLKDDNGDDLPADSPFYCPPNLPSPPSPPNTANPACIKGFHYWQGEFSTLMFPSTVDENNEEHKHPGAIAQRITASGDIYGCVHDHDLGPSMHGAAWTRSGTFSLISNGGQLSDLMAVPMSMNNGATPGNYRTIVGFFTDMLNQQHGYLVRQGMLESYDPTPATNLTAIWDINPGGQFVGTYRELGEATAKRHGFVQASDGSASITLDFTCPEPGGCGSVPFGMPAFATSVFGINPDGIVAGQYVLVSGGALHGFVAVPAGAN